MLKTMKYEVIRNKMVIIILFSILGGAEAIFLMGLAGDSRNLIGYGILGLVLGTSIIYFVIWLLGIMSFSHDLRDKTGYMVFLTPVNPYKIIIAKMLVGLIELTAAALFFIILAAIDIRILFNKFGESSSVFDAVAKFVGASKDTIWAGIVAFVISLVFSVLLYYSLAYFVSAVSSLMAKSTGVQRFLTITFVILFMIFFSVLSKSMPKFTNDISNEPISKLVEEIPTYLLSLGFTALFTYGCGYLMKNKLSL